MLSIFVTGVVTGFALIVAVGAQNAFVLRQGIRGEHVLPVIVVCMVSDMLAITVGVAGLGVVLERWPAVLPIAQIGGGLYLLAFGVQSAMRAWRPAALDADGGTTMTVRRAVLLTLALTWLNPHFYLDAILMLGTVANSFGDHRWWFCAGALAASARLVPRPSASVRAPCAASSPGRRPGGCSTRASPSSWAPWASACWCTDVPGGLSPEARPAQASAKDIPRSASASAAGRSRSDRRRGGRRARPRSAPPPARGW